MQAVRVQCFGLLERSFVMFCQENDEIRCASIMLLGNLSKFGSGEPIFKDQIHNVLVSLLLHLNDPNPQVVKVSVYSAHTPTTMIAYNGYKYLNLVKKDYAKIIIMEILHVCVNVCVCLCSPRHASMQCACVLQL